MLRGSSERGRIHDTASMAAQRRHGKKMLRKELN
jgi:hypothetical protein